MRESARSKHKRLWSFLLALVIAVTVVPGGVLQPLEAKAAPISWDLSVNGALNIPSSNLNTDYLVTGSLLSSSVPGIVVPQGYQGTITLQDVTITTTVASSASAMMINGSGNNATVDTYVTVVLSGSNTLHACTNGNNGNSGSGAGLEVKKGATVHLQAINPDNNASGYLYAAATDTRGSGGGGAGIGAANVAGSGGNVVISSGDIKAAGAYHGAGIGGAYSGAGAYSGKVVIYGGKIDCEAGQHGAGIGAGCTNSPNAGGTILVLPGVESIKTTAGNKGNLGGLTNMVYFGDSSQPALTVRTENNDKNADIYVDVSNVPVLADALDLAPDLDASELWLGNTGSTGILNTNATINQPAAFSTDHPTPSGYKYLTIESAVTSATTVVLPYPYMPSSTTSANNNDLTYGYTSAQATTAAVGTITITNPGSAALTNISIDKSHADNSNFTIIPTLTGTGTTESRLPVGGTIAYKAVLNDNLPAGTYTARIAISGQTEAQGNQTINATITQKVVKRDGDAGGDITVSATPASGNINSTNTKVALGVNVAAPHTFESARYQVTNSSSYPSGGTWTSFVNGDEVELSTNGTSWYIHWQVEADSMSSNSGHTSAAQGSKSPFGPYNVDTVRPQVASITTSETVVNKDPFTVTIVFDKPVDSGTLLAGIDVTNGSKAGLSPTSGYNTTYTFTLTPANNLSSGDSINIKVLENAAFDNMGNGNLSSADGLLNGGSGISFNDDKPYVTAWSVTDGQIFTDDGPANVAVTVTAYGKGTDPNGLFIGGTKVNSGNAATVAAGLFDLRRNGTSIPFTLTYADNATGGVFTLTPASLPLHNDSAYEVRVASGILENCDNNSMDAFSRSFEIRKPLVNTMTIDKPTLTQDGGSITVTVTGQNLHTALDLLETQPAGATVPRQMTTVNAAGTQATYTVVIAANNDTTTKTYRFDARLAGTNTGDSVTTVVAAATPTLTGDPSYGLFAAPNTMTYYGGPAKLTLKGENLNNFPGLRIVETNDLDATTRSWDITGLGLKASTATVDITIPQNTSPSAVTYTYTAYASGVAIPGGTDTIAVADATPTLTGDPTYGLTASPNTMNYLAGPATLTLKGENLNNFPGLRIVETNDLDATTRVWDINGMLPGVQTTTINIVIPQNTDISDVTYTYTAQSGGIPIANGVDTIFVGTAAPSFPSDGSSALTATPTQLDNDGGNVRLVLSGTNLHNFSPLEIRDNHSNVYTISASDISSDFSTATIDITLPANLDRDDLDYIYTVYSAVVGNGPATAQTNHTATVVVEGSRPRVEQADGYPLKHNSSGGSTHIVIEGKYLENALPLELRDNKRGDVFSIPTPSVPGTTSADITLSFYKDPSEHRNTIYELEVYMDGLPTGEVVVVEVGDSIPRVTGFDASPAYFSRGDTAGGNAKSDLTVLGDYLYNLELQLGQTLEIYDTVNQQWYTVNTSYPQDDETAIYVATIPSNVGVYTFELYLDGQYTGYDAYVAVDTDISTWDGDEEYVDIPPTDPADKEWTGRGGGHKGGGFTGDLTFDFLFHHTQQAVLQNPDNASIILQNVWFIAKSQLDFAASGAREADWRNGRVTIWFDTTLPGNDQLLEGRLKIDPFEAIYSLYPTVCTCPEETLDTKTRFAQRFGNSNIAVVRLFQTGSFGTEVEVAANLDLTNFQTDTLYLYRYDTETGDFTRLTGADPSIDKNGFLHFQVRDGGDIVITDAPLTEGGASVTSGQFQVSTGIEGD